MKSENAPETPATKFLRQNRIAHSTHLYSYEEHGGTRVSSRELNVDEHAVIKTLVMELADSFCSGIFPPKSC